jgi:hypothetical protein
MSDAPTPPPPAPAASAPPGAVPVNRTIVIGDVLGTTFKLWIANLIPFGTLALLIYAPYLIWNLVMPPATGFGAFSVGYVVAQLLQSFLGSLLTAALVYGVVRGLRGQKTSLGESLKFGLSRVVAVFLVGLCVGIVVFIGTLLFIVPGIIASCILSVAIPAAVVERLGVGAAMSRSSDLTRGSRWQIFGLYVVIFLLAMVIGMVLVPVFVTLSAGIAAFIVGIVTVLVSSLLSGILAAVLYHRLRSLKEGTSVDQIAAVFQ